MHTTIKLGLYLCCVFFLLYGQSQDQGKVDSVRSILENQNLNKDERLSSYHWLSAYSKSPEEKLNYGELTLELAKEVNNQEFIAKANLRIGVAHRFLGNLGKSLEFLFQSANDAGSLKDFEPLLANIYAEISTCYTQNGDSENALLYGSKTIEILRKSDNNQQLALTLLNYGYDYYLIGNYDSAMSYYNESEPILDEIGFTIGLAYITGNRALIYWKQGQNDQAKRDLFKAIEMLEPLGDQYGMADYYNQLGNIYLDENDPENAITYTMKGLEMAKEEGLKEQVRDASYLLFRLHRDGGEHKVATDYLIQHYAYKDSIQNLETTQQLANLRTEFEVGQKQVEVDLLLEQRRSNQIIMFTGGIILVIVIVLAILIYYYSQTKTRLNKQLQEQRDSLITLNKTKDKFFSIISHDLRGPAGVLNGLVDVIKHDLEELNKEELDEMLDLMESSVDRLVKLLDNLLNWALQQTGHFSFQPEALNLKSILSDVADIFKNMAVSKKIKLNVQIEEDFELHVDKYATSTIFRNLVNNAIKFTPSGGQIDIIAEKDVENGIGSIKFIDNGIGIPDDKLKTLFSLNENMSTKGTSGETGLGLGLQLVYEFVQLNKGEIDVESEQGKGTTFCVRLPLATPSEVSEVVLD